MSSVNRFSVKVKGDGGSLADFYLPVVAMSFTSKPTIGDVQIFYVSSQETEDAVQARLAFNVEFWNKPETVMFYSGLIASVNQNQYADGGQSSIISTNNGYTPPTPVTVGNVPLIKEETGFGLGRRMTVGFQNDNDLRPLAGDTVTVAGQTFVVASATWKLRGEGQSFGQVTDGKAP